MDLYTTVVGFFQDGGPFMYPIAIVLGIGVAIALERYFYLSSQTRVNRKDFERILPLLKQRRARELGELTRKSKSAMSRIVADGMNRQTSTRRRADIEYAMEEGLLEVLPNIERRTPYLATFANIATLLGLLGTIIGLIAAFTAVANADPAEKATLLSQSISLAMNTTAFGLMAAIPLLLIHSMLQSKTSAIVESLEIAVVKFLNLMENGGEALAQATATAKRKKAPASA
ncbi:MAG: MotA/TolQ/ExbB proton channel family protein [Gammaproteobacteria bacterium]|nr:MotA/TolQ/ExbB proton channel family protein [Gammaproteobacteria bacterium]